LSTSGLTEKPVHAESSPSGSTPADQSMQVLREADPPPATTRACDLFSAA